MDPWSVHNVRSTIGVDYANAPANPLSSLLSTRASKRIRTGVQLLFGKAFMRKEAREGTRRRGYLKSGPSLPRGTTTPQKNHSRARTNSSTRRGREFFPVVRAMESSPPFPWGKGTGGSRVEHVGRQEINIRSRQQGIKTTSQLTGYGWEIDAVDVDGYAYTRKRTRKIPSATFGGCCAHFPSAPCRSRHPDLPTNAGR